MLSTALTTLAISITSFVLVMLLVSAEKSRGRRFFLTSFRVLLDGAVSKIEFTISDAIDHFVKYVVRLNWYYGIHSFLTAVLALIVKSYEYVEKVFEHNRHRTKELRAEKKSKESGTNHLTEMAKHKVDTKLTPSEAKRRKKHHLEGR